MSVQIFDKRERPLHDLRISVIDRCNFRCPYCMPEQEHLKNYTFLKENQWLTYDEIIRLTRLFTECGVTKVRITGGEPLLRPNLSHLIYRLNKIPCIKDIALTTNGSLLSKYASELKQAGLNRITVSLDSLTPNIYKIMTGGKGELKNVLEGIAAAEQEKFDCIKINVVIQKGMNEQCIMDLVNYFRGKKSILRFIEYMDVGTCNQWEFNNVVSAKEILNIINAHYPVRSLKENYYGEVASRYEFIDGSGEIGFIPSVTQPFCQSCTRARLSTDGKIYTCLFSKEGVDLRQALRNKVSDNELRMMIKETWNIREDRYSELRMSPQHNHNTAQKVEMFQIGG